MQGDANEALHAAASLSGYIISRPAACRTQMHRLSCSYRYVAPLSRWTMCQTLLLKSDSDVSRPVYTSYQEFSLTRCCQL